MKNMWKKQRGIGFWGWSSILAMLAFLVLIGVRLFPLYNEKLQVDAAMASVQNNTSLKGASKHDITMSFLKNVQIGGSRRFDSNNIKDYQIFEKPRKKGDPKLQYRIKYEARSPFFDVIQFVLVYDKAVVPGGGKASKESE